MKITLLSSVIVIGWISILNTIAAGDRLVFLLPNFLLFTPFHHLATPLWRVITPEDILPAKRRHTPIVEIDHKDYTFARLREITGGFMEPAVVRGMFSNTTAVRRWSERGYLAAQEGLGDRAVRVQRRGSRTTVYIDKVTPELPFQKAYHEILDDEGSDAVLFFPFFKDRASVLRDPLVRTMNRLVKEDLEVDRVWRGFGAFETHASMVGHQFSVGRSRSNGGGTFDWHTEPGSNWFAQVSGSKTWYFMSPKHSSVMSPNHTAVGIRTLQTSAGELVRSKYWDRLPLQYVTLRPGDMLFNPEWVWHTVVKEEGGLCFGVAMREFNLTLSVQSSLHYVGVTVTTHLFKNLRSLLF